MTDPAAPPQTTRVRRCPICNKPRVEAHSPFCSTRCRDRDLVRWLDEGYAVPGPPADPEMDN
ncbi:DNA gyrase inhibitor YacG [Novosphingobium cyanobacteriorum]|uniref:DNA gyrase inhibitor YacG n=1 Tax=Novosphingobium cyanobacteriorum TaxID=3024215 RepID=A0ABT6CF10_9SPHN|nr:DNA gyrase inhibitor YacG [Novosphingobium cyanobacteriorum]MDF8332503.1 DNA gyrase inhibitor YacG [Novosphingobium cyanobacteriorum]